MIRRVVGRMRCCPAGVAVDDERSTCCRSVDGVVGAWLLALLGLTRRSKAVFKRGHSRTSRQMHIRERTEWLPFVCFFSWQFLSFSPLALSLCFSCQRQMSTKLTRASPRITSSIQQFYPSLPGGRENLSRPNVLPLETRFSRDCNGH